MKDIQRPHKLAQLLPSQHNQRTLKTGSNGGKEVELTSSTAFHIETSQTMSVQPQ